ncbi:archaeosortase/exosortase family protein [Sulfobacillus thermosulfidooxidans]|uniref:archaeosortase/exosortase family protein n=1 Tax=Sulfobacillus thermosulfidooxidans TaxID=28034 RepID=UPI001494408B|nr:archaeosortase/exosortase family protein [Sulfobacillus thermosulfidooxidans]
MLWTLWVIVSIFPLLAYASPLWQNVLADTPIADLIWIPILALGWATWSILTGDFNRPDDSELNGILGLTLAVVVGLSLVLGPVRWPTFFVFNHGGLLLWPLWILAMTWIFWGIEATRKVFAPLLYLVLVWPPIFEAIANNTQTALVKWAIAVLNDLSHHVSWLHAAQIAGTFGVNYHGQNILVVVAEACSGADSLLGAAIVIPVIWFMLQGGNGKKTVLSSVALFGALILNWIRLAVIVLCVHILGPSVTFHYIHPVLGFILFGLLAVMLVILLKPLKLHMPTIQMSSTVRFAGWGRISGAVLVSAVLFFFLRPLFNLAQGTFGNPSPVKRYRVATFLPSLPQFQKSPAYYANESSVLGPDSATQADLYVMPHSGKETLVEMWSTANASRLATYGFHACLLYHGDNIVASQSFQLVHGVVATAYAVSLPPSTVGGQRSTYVDIEWSDAVKTSQGIRYQRWSIASFPASTPNPTNLHLPNHLEPLTAIEAMTAPGTHGLWPLATLHTKTVLIALADEMFHASLRNHE